MSNKQWRTPPRAELLAEAEAARKLVERLSHGVAQSAAFGKAAEQHRELAEKPLPEGAVTDDEMRGMLGTAARFLHKVTQIAHDVLNSVPADRLCCVFVEECAVNPAFAKEAEAVGVDVSSHPQPEPRPQGDHRKLPRGRVHPLIVLMRLGLQAARQLNQVARGTNPATVNALSAQELLEKAHLEVEAAMWAE